MTRAQRLRQPAISRERYFVAEKNLPRADRCARCGVRVAGVFSRPSAVRL
jgi:hypothetical protein